MEKIIVIHDHDKLFTEVLALLTVSENENHYHHSTSLSGWAHCAKPLLSDKNQVGWLVEGVLNYEFIQDYKESWIEILQDEFNKLELCDGPDTKEADEYTLGVYWCALQNMQRIVLDNGTILRRNIFGFRKYKYTLETEHGARVYNFNTQEEFVDIITEQDLWLELGYQSWRCEKASLLTKLVGKILKK